MSWKFTNIKITFKMTVLTSVLITHVWYGSVKIYQRVFPWSSLSPSSCQCGVPVWQTWKYNKYVYKYILFQIEVNIIQLLHLNEINMRFYGAEYNNIELGERVQYCCTLLHKTRSSWSVVIVLLHKAQFYYNFYILW